MLYTTTLIIAKVVIPAPYQVRGKLQQESRPRPCEGREPLFKKHWIPGRARNDKPYKTYVVMYNYYAANPNNKIPISNVLIRIQ